MAAKTIKVETVLAVVLVFIAGEFLAYLVLRQFSMPPLTILGMTRLIQIGVLIWLILRLERRLSAIGWSPDTWRAGLLQGALWSLGFGVLTGIVMAIAQWQGYQPLSFFRGGLSAHHVPTYFIVGGLVAPVFEELCFRGVIYTYMRQTGLRIGSWLFSHFKPGMPFGRLESTSAVVFAVVSSTVVFAMLHFVQGLPVTQIVGGIVFAVAYEISGNLMVPITIHVTGNLAIFSLSLL